MKKFLLSLAVLFAGAASAQQYRTGDLVYELEEGAEYLMTSEDVGVKFLTQDSWNYVSTTANDSAKVTFEATGEQTDEGYELYVLKFVASGEYVKDQVLPKGYDGSDVAQMKRPYIFTTSNIDEAAKWTVLPAQTRYKLDFEEEGYMDNWRTWTNQGQGEDTQEDVAAGIQNKVPFDGAWVLMNAHLVKEGNAPTYFEHQGTDEVYAMFAEWGENSWFLWTAEEMTDLEILEAYVLAMFPNGMTLVKGECPGQYMPETVEAVEAVYARFEAVSLGESDEDPAVVLADFKAAMENLKVNEMREGYYYIEPNRQVPPGSGKKGLIFDEGGAIRAQEFARPDVLTVEASRYIWYFKPATEEDVLNAYAEPKENAYYIQNYGTSKWATNVVADLTGNGEKTFTTGDEPAVYVFEYLSVIPGTVYIYTHQSKGKCTGNDNCPYCAAWNLQNHGKHWILKWNARWDEGNMMFLFPVAQEEVDAIRDQVVQYDINQRLLEVYTNAKNSYARGITYAPSADVTLDDQFESHGYLTYSVDSVLNEETGELEAVVNTNLSVVDANGGNAVHPSDGQGIAGALDNDRTTFMHTFWSGTTYPHNFDIVLPEDGLEAISVKIMRRFGTSEHNGSFSPKEMEVYTRNDTAAEWVSQGRMFVNYNIPVCDYDSAGNATVNQANGFAHNNFVGVGAIGFDAKYKYVRLAHSLTNNDNANTYCSLSEIGVYGAQYDPNKSLNNAVPQEIKDALLAEMAKAEAELAAGKGTEAQIVALKEAYEAYLEVYPDPTRLVETVAAAKDIAELVATATDSVGDKGVGYYPLAAVEAFNAKIVEVEGTIVDLMPLDAINAGVQALEDAYSALKKTLVLPEAGTYVRIRSNSSNANFVNGIVYARGGDVKRGIVPGIARQQAAIEQDPETGEDVTVRFDNALIKGSITSAWLVEEVKDNTMALRSVGSGLYLQNDVPVNNEFSALNTEKVFVELLADGMTKGGYVNFVLGTDTVTKNALFMNTAGSDYLVGWHSAGGNDNSTFYFETIESLGDFEDGAYVVEVGANANKIVTLPVNATYYASDANVYEVAGYCAADGKLYFTPVEDGTPVVAGTPLLVNTGQDITSLIFYQDDAVESIEDLTFGYEGKDVNGMVGTVFGQNVADGLGYLTNYGAIVATESTVNNGETEGYRIGAFSGYFNGKNIPAIEENPGVDPEDPTTGLAIELDLDIISAIENVEIEAAAAKGGVYTISGVRLNSTKNLPAGLYIIDGKKVIK